MDHPRDRSPDPTGDTALGERDGGVHGKGDAFSPKGDLELEEEREMGVDTDGSRLFRRRAAVDVNPAAEVALEFASISANSLASASRAAALLAPCAAANVMNGLTFASARTSSLRASKCKIRNAR
jgi:hypothetical protein